jgi:glutamine amidotransferase
MKIGIVNYGMGNIASVVNALSFVGFESELIEKPTDFNRFNKIILPGVGAFGAAMKNLKESQLAFPIANFITNKNNKLLGLCLGMQLLFDSSEENGQQKGLGIIEGVVTHLSAVNSAYPIPHMGWNNIKSKNKATLLQGIDNNELDFYFVHSYYCKCKNSEDIAATVAYGDEIDVMVEKENVFGCQFHPEKSQKSGLTILKNFCCL